MIGEKYGSDRTIKAPTQRKGIGGGDMHGHSAG